MNAITRVYTNGAVRTQRVNWSLGTKILIILMVISAFVMVYLKDLNRRTFIQYQNMVHANQQAQIDWGKLLLEQSTWSAQAHVQQVATDRLQMVTPTTKNIVLIAE